MPNQLHDMQPSSYAASQADGLPGVPATLTVPPGTWIVDPTRSVVEFIARHFVVAKVRGRFSDVTGTLVVTEGAVGSTIVARADVRSVNTGDRARDDHLRSSDFFDAEHWPDLTLEGRVVSLTSWGLHLLGDLTIRGTTRAVTFDVVVRNLRTGPAAAELTATAHASVNRKDFGLCWNATIETGGVVVADQVEVAIEVVARRAET